MARRADGEARGTGLPRELRISGIRRVAERANESTAVVLRCYRGRMVELERLTRVTCAALELGYEAPAWGHRLPAEENWDRLRALGWTSYRG
jgi:hypothetical protein